MAGRIDFGIQVNVGNVSDPVNAQDVATKAYVDSRGGGGGGGFSLVTAKWTTANNASKNAYTSPSVVNSDGITINLTATSNPGVLANATISLNSVNLTNTYAVTGTFPNYVITIPSADLAGNAAETAATVIVNVLIGTAFNVMANNLTNVQPISFNATLNAGYAVTSVAYYTTTANVNYNYNVTGTATTFAGTVNGNIASSATGTLANQNITGLTLGGTVTGNGQFGAQQGAVVNITGSVAGLSTYTPAFYAGASTGNTAPTFTTASSQTPNDQVGSTITYTVATASSQYVWLATTRPIASVRQLTTFGQATVVADVTTTQTIAGTIFNVFGFTNLSTTTAVQLIIIN